MRRKSLYSLAIGAIALLGIGMTSTSQAFPLTLTQAGIDAGFTLDRVVTGLNGVTDNCCFVLGVAVASDGTIVLNNASNQRNYHYNNVNNQVGTAAAIDPAGAPDFGFPTAITNANGTLFAGGGVMRRLNNDGSTAQTYNGINISLGAWTNPVNQHIIAVGSFSGGSGLIDIDVSDINNPSVRLINGAFSDGVTVSPDGTIVYTNSAAFLISDGTQVGSFFVSGADGMGVIVSTNELNGNIIVSTTNGFLVMLEAEDLAAQTIIANNGGYGDFANADPTTGTLLVSSGDNLFRLGCGEGCGVGAPPPAAVVPAPTTLWLLGIGLLALARFGRRMHS